MQQPHLWSGHGFFGQRGGLAFKMEGNAIYTNKFIKPEEDVGQYSSTNWEEHQFDSETHILKDYNLIPFNILSKIRKNFNWEGYVLGKRNIKGRLSEKLQDMAFAS